MNDLGIASAEVVDGLARRGLDETTSRVDRIVLTTQRSSRLLEDEEIETLARRGRAPHP